MAEILRKLADVVDGQEEHNNSEVAPGQEDHAVINVKSMTPPLQQKLDLMKQLAGVDNEEGEEDICPECNSAPCECGHAEDEMAIMKRNAGIAPVVVALADEDEPWEG